MFLLFSIPDEVSHKSDAEGIRAKGMRFFLKNVFFLLTAERQGAMLGKSSGNTVQNPPAQTRIRYGIGNRIPKEEKMTTKRRKAV
ncbi:MAG: hypothetical protein ACI4OI_02375, partial [Gemmiger sp.]